MHLPSKCFILEILGILSEIKTLFIVMEDMIMKGYFSSLSTKVSQSVGLLL